MLFLFFLLLLFDSFIIVATGPPSSPAGPLTATDIDGTELTLSWQPPTHDGGSPLTGYFLEKREGNKAFWGKVARLPPDETKYRVTDLTEGTNYSFRVSAENKDGSSKPLEMGEPVTPKSALSKLHTHTHTNTHTRTYTGIE